MMTLFRVLVLSVIAFGLPAPPAASAWRGKNFASHFDYLNIILIDTINFITLENSPIKSGAQDSFCGCRVGLVREVGGLEALFENHDKIQVVGVALLKQLPPMLAHERFDAIVSDPVSLNEAVKTLNSPLKHKLVALDPPLKKNLNSPLIAKTHPDKARIIGDFDRA